MEMENFKNQKEKTEGIKLEFETDLLSPGLDISFKNLEYLLDNDSRVIVNLDIFLSKKQLRLSSISTGNIIEIFNVNFKDVIGAEINDTIMCVYIYPLVQSKKYVGCCKPTELVYERKFQV